MNFFVGEHGERPRLEHARRKYNQAGETKLEPIGYETLIARPLGQLRMVNAAGPAYLERSRALTCRGSR